MKQPWIHNKKADSWLILSPPFLVLFCVFAFQGILEKLENGYSFYTWLFLIVFVDVAHVYSTLFKTYFNKKEVQSRRFLYYGIPLLSWTFGIFFYQLGSLIFWSALALVAVYHFVRQQYGFVRLYSRLESNSWSKKCDELAIYSATLFPMLYWFSTPRAFNWFVNNEFTWLQKIVEVLPFLKLIYILISFIWITKTLYLFYKTKQFNIPKNLIIIGTYLSWFFGIVYFNNDLVFTFLNVVSHGIPYVALIYLREIEQKQNSQLQWLSIFKNSYGIFLFITVILVLAFFEELLWELLVWNEHFTLGINLPTSILGFLVPLLVVPQLTHYLLDGFIWKNNAKKIQ